MVKLLGSILIVISTWGIGSCFSMEYKKKIVFRQNLVKMMDLISREIAYHRCTIPDAFIEVSEKIMDPFQAFLKAICVEMKKKDGNAFADIWKNMVMIYFKDFEESDKLTMMGIHLGYLDISLQTRTIEQFIEEENEKIIELKQDLKIKTRLYNCLGAVSGLFLVILLI